MFYAPGGGGGGDSYGFSLKRSRAGAIAVPLITFKAGFH